MQLFTIKNLRFNLFLNKFYYGKIALAKPQAERNDVQSNLLNIYLLGGVKTFQIIFLFHTKDAERERKNEREVESSVTRLGDLLDFGQLFKACGNN